MLRPPPEAGSSRVRSNSVAKRLNCTDRKEHDALVEYFGGEVTPCAAHSNEVTARLPLPNAFCSQYVGSNASIERVVIELSELNSGFENQAPYLEWSPMDWVH